MTHYELLGLRPEAGDADVLEAILAARASWERRRDAAADQPSAERARAALSRLDEAARDLGTPGARRAYDDATLPQDVLRRIRSDAPPPLVDPENDEAAERTRIEAEEAIRADAERRREARKHQEEVERQLPLPEPEPPAPEPVAETNRIPNKKGKRRQAIRSPHIDWRSVGLLAFATAAGIGIALVPIAIVTQGGPRAGTEGGPTREDPTQVTPQAMPLADATGSRVGPASVPASVGASNPAAAAEAASAALATALSEPASDFAAPVLPYTQPATVVVVVQQAPQPTPAPSAERLQAILQKAFAAYSAGRYHESLGLYDEVLGQRPDDPIARVARALTLLAMGRAHDAEVECRIAIKVQPAFPEAHFNLGVALHRQRRDEEAVAAFKKFVDLAPDDRAAPQARGFIARYNLARQRATMARPATR